MKLIFIIYHQISELYFKLSLHEFEQIAHNGKKVMPNGEDLGWNEKMDVKFFIERVTRINRYLEALTKSFDIMVDGMEQAQFLSYRMALLPASGFQSAQYRLIEISSTDFIQLVDKDVREKLQGKNASIEEMYEHITGSRAPQNLRPAKKRLRSNNLRKNIPSSSFN